MYEFQRQCYPGYAIEPVKKISVDVQHYFHHHKRPKKYIGDRKSKSTRNSKNVEGKHKAENMELTKGMLQQGQLEILEEKKAGYVPLVQSEKYRLGEANGDPNASPKLAGSPLPAVLMLDDDGRVNGEPGVDPITQERMKAVRRHSGALLDENTVGKLGQGSAAKEYPGLYEQAARNPDAEIDDLIDGETGRTRPALGRGGVEGSEGSGEESPDDRPGGGSPNSPLSRYNTRKL